ncbi:MAG TPA: signal peptide peptidase SppA [Dehalococcoidia bacterium]|jgi:protease-4|nr:signal peptide peptidase SppA [Dehalococcoidia bacterium]
MLVLQSLIDMPWARPRIAVLEIGGAIGAQVRGPEMVRAIKGLREDPRVQAVVVEIDSPGGSAAVSDMIHRALVRLGKKKPVVAFTGTAALSGGYLIACSAQKIVALPTSLVGSIGVIFTRPVVQELMQKLGVRMVVTHEGKLKAMFQPWREPTPEETAKVQALTEEYYDWFVNTVATSRNLSVPAVKELATGEMYSASKGKDAGLVDELGDFERATELAKELANLVETPRLQWVRPRRPLLERVLARGGTAMAKAVLAEAETRILPRIDFR